RYLLDAAKIRSAVPRRIALSMAAFTIAGAAVVAGGGLQAHRAEAQPNEPTVAPTKAADNIQTVAPVADDETVSDSHLSSSLVIPFEDVGAVEFVGIGSIGEESVTWWNPQGYELDLAVPVRATQSLLSIPEEDDDQKVIDFDLRGRFDRPDVGVEV